MNIKDFDPFRSALLGILLGGLVLAAWHISWLHRHSADRYELQVSPRAIHVLDRQERVVYTTSVFSGNDAPAWSVAPLPK